MYSAMTGCCLAFVATFNTVGAAKASTFFRSAYLLNSQNRECETLKKIEHAFNKLIHSLVSQRLKLNHREKRIPFSNFPHIAHTHSRATLFTHRDHLGNSWTTENRYQWFQLGSVYGVIVCPLLVKHWLSEKYWLGSMYGVKLGMGH